MLHVLCDELFDEAQPEHRQLRAQLDGYRRTIVGATDSDQVAPIADACIATLTMALRARPATGRASAARNWPIVVIPELVGGAPLSPSS